jgi:hypothetical protein
VRPCDPKDSLVEELACYRQGVRSRARTPTDTPRRHVTWDCGSSSARTLTQVYLLAGYRHWSARSSHTEHSQDRKCTRDRSTESPGTTCRSSGVLCSRSSRQNRNSYRFTDYLSARLSLSCPRLSVFID